MPRSLLLPGGNWYIQYCTLVLCTFTITAADHRSVISFMMMMPEVRETRSHNTNNTPLSQPWRKPRLPHPRLLTGNPTTAMVLLVVVPAVVEAASLSRRPKSPKITSRCGTWKGRLWTPGCGPFQHSLKQVRCFFCDVSRGAIFVYNDL